jgi:hypothetical protein
MRGSRNDPFSPAKDERRCGPVKFLVATRIPLCNEYASAGSQCRNQLRSQSSP